ncbi:hypothetical protein [Actimicrobium antarcticum]|uniref:Uncharacterized protein n=1 Tax=Actimicrobium antarcticum TaxID=1051899 RepID=A0ABP7TUS7_9BURK
MDTVNGSSPVGIAQVSPAGTSGEQVHVAPAQPAPIRLGSSQPFNARLGGGSDNGGRNRLLSAWNKNKNSQPNITTANNKTKKPAGLPATNNSQQVTNVQNSNTSNIPTATSDLIAAFGQNLRHALDIETKAAGDVAAQADAQAARASRSSDTWNKH